LPRRAAEAQDTCVVILLLQRRRKIDSTDRFTYSYVCRRTVKPLRTSACST